MHNAARFRRGFGTLALAALGLESSGCAVISHTPHEPAARPVLLDAAFAPPPVFEQARAEPAPAIAPLAPDRSRYERYRLEFPPVADGGGSPIALTADLHRSLEPGARRLVIVLPIWGSADFPQRKVVETLLERSAGALHVIAVHGGEALVHWKALARAGDESRFIGLMRDSARRVGSTVVALRQLVDWIEQNGEVEIDIVGFSMGALVASMALGVDDRLSGGVLMMGGAGPAEILATCGSRKVRRVRRNAQTRFGWTDAELRAVMDGFFAEGDARRFSGRYDSGRILIIDGLLDGCMNADSREALWEATGRPERYRLLTTHRWAFLALTPLARNMAGRMIHDFIASRRAPSAPPRASGYLTASLDRP